MVGDVCCWFFVGRREGSGCWVCGGKLCLGGGGVCFGWSCVLGVFWVLSGGGGRVVCEEECLGVGEFWKFLFWVVGCVWWS